MLWDVDLLYEQKSGARWCPEVIIPWIDQPFFNSTLVHENFFPSTGISRKFELFFFFPPELPAHPKLHDFKFCFWEALIYLTHLDPEHMENLVLQRVAHECLERKDDLERWCPTMLLSQKPLKEKRTNGWVGWYCWLCAFLACQMVFGQKGWFWWHFFFLGWVSCPKTKWFGRFFWSSLFWIFEWSTWGKIIFSSNICRTRGRSEGCFFGQDIPENERQVQQVHLKNHYQSKSGKSSSNPKASTLASKRLPSRGS